MTGDECTCRLNEVCHMCRKCLEAHCICGRLDSSYQICIESRACTCQVESSSARCKYCRGCIRVTGYSHCRCTQHNLQRLKRCQVFQDSLIMDDAGLCVCFEDEVSDKTNEKKSEQLRIRRLRRKLGSATVESIYDRKIGLSDQHQAVNRKTLLRSKMNRSNQQRALHLEKGISYLETIDIKENICKKSNTQERSSSEYLALFERGLENLNFFADRESLMPSNDLVDYIVYLSSLKISNIPELIGSFEDSAAVATAIVVEEYLKQIVQDLLERERFLFSVGRHEKEIRCYIRRTLQGSQWKGYDPSSDQQLIEHALMEEISLLVSYEEDRKVLRKWIIEEIERVWTNVKRNESKNQSDSIQRSLRDINMQIEKKHTGFAAPSYKISLEASTKNARFNVNMEGLPSNQRAIQVATKIGKQLECLET